MTFSKSFSIPREDYFKFSKFVVSRLRKSGNQSILNLKNIILWFATTLMFMFIFQSFNDNDFNIDWFSFGIGAFPFLVFFLVFALETVKLQKLSAPKESGIVLGEQTLEIDDKGITVLSLNYRADFTWSCIEEIIENEGDFYFFIDTTNALIIPQKALFNKDDLENLRGYIEKYA